MTSASGAPTTLDQARQWLRANFEKGAKCPCCGKFAKLYKRKLNSSMAYALILLSRPLEKYEEFRPPVGRPYRHVPSYLMRCDLSPEVKAAIRGDWAKLKHWGFIESWENPREDKSARAGWWRITPEGLAFANGTTNAPKYVYIYNKKIVTRVGDMAQVSIADALGDRFSYAELMASTPDQSRGR